MLLSLKAEGSNGSTGLPGGVVEGSSRYWLVSVEYPGLADYVAVAAEVMGLDLDTVMKIADSAWSNSALHAPAAGFGDTEGQLTPEQISCLKRRSRDSCR